MYIIMLMFCMLQMSAADKKRQICAKPKALSLTLKNESPGSFTRLIKNAEKDGQRYHENRFGYKDQSKNKNDCSLYGKQFGDTELTDYFKKISSMLYLDYFKRLATTVAISDGHKLNELYLMIPYWKTLAQQSQEQKDKGLQLIFNYNLDTQYSYPIGRLLYAAALHAGANPNISLSEHSKMKLLKISLDNEDTGLLQLCLEKSANPNSVLASSYVVENGIGKDRGIYALSCVKNKDDLGLLMRYKVNFVMQELRDGSWKSLCIRALQKKDLSFIDRSLHCTLLGLGDDPLYSQENNASKERLKKLSNKWFESLKKALDAIWRECSPKFNDKNISDKSAYYQSIVQRLVRVLKTREDGSVQREALDACDKAL